MFDIFWQNNFSDPFLLADSVKAGSYVALFLLSVLVSYLFPMPEAVMLMLVGYASRSAEASVPSVFLVCAAGIIAGDNILYRLSFFGSKYVERFNRKMRRSKLIKYEYAVKDNIGAAIWFLRFVAGVRFFGPALSGTLGVRWRRFFFHNALASLAHTALFMAIGYAFHERIIAIVAQVEIVKNILLVSSAFIAGVLVSIFMKKSGAGPAEHEEPDKGMN